MVAARGRDEAKIWRILDYYGHGREVLRQWPGLVFDIWCPWLLPSSNPRQIIYFELRHLLAQRRAGRSSISTLDAASSTGDDVGNFAAAAALADVPLGVLLGPEQLYTPVASAAASVAAEAAAAAAAPVPEEPANSPLVLRHMHSGVGPDVFASSPKFSSHCLDEVMDEASVAALKERNIDSFICEVESGADIKTTIIDRLDQCKMAVVMGSVTYGENECFAPSKRWSTS